MNFGVVEQNNGNLVSMLGVLTEVGGTTLTTQGKPKAICKIQDDTGVSHNVHIHQGKGLLPTTALLNRKCQFSISTFQGNHQGQSYTGYSGFWNDRAQVGQQSVPQTLQQGPSQATERPKETEKVSQDVWDAKDERMASMNALNRAVDLWIADKKPFGECSLFESADMMVGYIYKAKPKGGQPNPAYCGEGGTGQQPPDDEIDF